MIRRLERCIECDLHLDAYDGLPLLRQLRLVPALSPSHRCHASLTRMSDGPPEEFFADLPTFNNFSGVADERNYKSLPEDWSLATADIVSSTRAIERGAYKAVNMAGVSVISAVLNALGHGRIPFVFGGDGALLAIPPAAVEKCSQALAE